MGKYSFFRKGEECNTYQYRLRSLPGEEHSMSQLGMEWQSIVVGRGASHERVVEAALTP